MKARVEGLSHLLIQVSDLSAAEHFYCDLLGLEIRSRSTFGGDRPLLVTHQGLGITLLPSSPPAPAPVENRNLEHVALWVNGLAGLMEQLQYEGFKVEGPIDSDYGQSIYVRDPDGNRIECIERKR